MRILIHGSQRPPDALVEAAQHHRSNGCAGYLAFLCGADGYWTVDLVHDETCCCTEIDLLGDTA
jgi:hypothetical protein